MPSCTCRTSSRCSSTSSRCRRHPTSCDCLLCRRPFSDVDRRAPAAGTLAGRRSEVVEQVTLESVHAEKPQCGARPRHASSMRAVTLGSWGLDRGIRLPVPRADRPRLRGPVSYTHLRAHETRHDLVCRLLLEKKKTKLEENIKRKLHNRRNLNMQNERKSQ